MNNTEIIKKLHLQQLSPEAQALVLAKVNESVEMRLAGTLQDLLNQDQLAAFERLEKTSPETVWNWLLQQEINNLSELYEAALSDYIDEVNQQTDTITAS